MSEDAEGGACRSEALVLCDGPKNQQARAVVKCRGIRRRPVEERGAGAQACNPSPRPPPLFEPAAPARGGERCQESVSRVP